MQGISDGQTIQLDLFPLADFVGHPRRFAYFYPIRNFPNRLPLGLRAGLDMGPPFCTKRLGGTSVRVGRKKE